MKKVKLQLPTGDWESLTTKFAVDDNRKVDQNAFTAGTQNIDTEVDGTIRKMKGGTQFYTLTTPADDQHEAIFSDGVRHLLTVDEGDLKFTAGTASATLVTSGYSTAANFQFANTQDRVYFGNGVNTNQVYDKTASYGGVGYSVPQTKAMGATAPGSAPTAALGAAGSNVPAGGHTYKVTFLYYDSEESNGGSASNLVTVTGANEQVDLTSVPIGGYGVTARKIYRDDNDGVYVLVGTISDNTTTTFSDTVAGGTTPIPTDNGTAPIFGQVKLFLDRLWFAQISGEPFTLYFSEAGLPDIVQSTNFIDCNPEDPITALSVYRGRLVVFNRRSMGQILGDTKDSFRYDGIAGSVGCVDNRSIQEIVLQGVPILVWLSDKGFYGFNGSSIFYLSEQIEDIINADIKQSVIQRNQKVDTNNADFNAGTLSDGISVAGGQFTTRGYVDGTSTVGSNPKRTWNDTDDWDNGDSLDNISTIGQSNKLTIVSDNSQQSGVQGTRAGVIPGATGDIGIKLAVSTDFTGETTGTTIQSVLGIGFGVNKVGWSFVPPRSGTFNGGSGYFKVQSTITSTITYKLSIYSDSAGSPGSVLYSSADIPINIPLPLGTLKTVDFTGVSVGNPTLTGGTRYHMVIEISSGFILEYNANQFSGEPVAKVFNTVSWLQPPTNVIGSGVNTLAYTFTSSPIAASGTWTSVLIDTQSTTADPEDITFTTVYPAGTGSTTLIQGGDEVDFAGNLVIAETQSLTDHTGTDTVTLGARRYYQIKITLTATDNRVTPTVTTAVILGFSDTAEWISEAIDTTGDATTYDTLSLVSTTPGASTVVMEIRTADTLGALGAAPWVTFGSHTVRKFAQVRLTLTKSGTDLPSVTSVDFTWTIVSNLISAEIDTNTDPTGWDIFQSTFTTNGGTVLLELRSAPTSGGLSGATWYTVTNGNFPTASLPTDQFIQWRATITATDSNVPTVSSVTIKWFIGDVSNVRAASIFFEKNYYIALAEFGSDENNIILELDSNGKWRLKRGLGVSTFGFFFNEPYFGLSTSGVIGKFLDSLTDLGTNSEINIITRAFDFSSSFFDSSEFIKIPEGITIEGVGTGATYDVSYSLDRGVTFTNMLDAVTGSTTFTTTDDTPFARVFRASDTNGARSIMYKIHTNDEFDIKLHRMKMTAFITTREPIITG